jgi:hypothetical protein
MAESPNHITCREVVELVSDYIEGALPADATELVEQHLNLCQGCEWYLDQMRIAVTVAGRSGEEGVSPEARERLLATFRTRRRA